MFTGTSFKRDQLVLVVKLAMISAVDRIESGTPTACINFAERVRIAGSEAAAHTLTSHDEGCLAAVANSSKRGCSQR